MVCLQGLPKGKVYSYNPATKETHLLASGFFYSNGIAVSDDGSYLVLSETDRLRLLKVWLKGAKVRQGCRGRAYALQWNCLCGSVSTLSFYSSTQ